MVCAGVRWVLPPKGISTLPAPMVESNRSTSPRREAHLRLPAISRRVLNRGLPIGVRSFFPTIRPACFTAPLEFKNSRLRSTTVSPRQRMTMRGLSVTVAT